MPQFHAREHCEAGRDAVDPKLAPSGCSTPGEIFMSVLLPAPFSPTRPWTSPGRSSRSTLVERRTFPNVFERLQRKRGVVKFVLVESVLDYSDAVRQVVGG